MGRLGILLHECDPVVDLHLDDRLGACTRHSLKITYQGTDNTAGHFHGVLTFTAPGASAHAAITITDTGVYDNDGEHVYNVDVEACNVDSISLVQVGPITD